jgi:hypothetical protein
MLFAVVATLVGGLSSLAAANLPGTLPSYHYGAPIHVECMNRSS